jgi:hypothetical protein
MQLKNGNLVIKMEKDNKKKIDPIFLEMDANLKAIREAVETLTNNGINEELLEMWIAKKTRIKVTDIRKVLKSQKEFFKNVLTE